MATPSIGLKGTMKLAPKIELKKTEMSLEDTEKAVKKIHSNTGEIVRVTLDIPQELHTEVKMLVAQKRVTLRDYLLSLIRQDMEK
jgi:hypothetical protein